MSMDMHDSDVDDVASDWKKVERDMTKVGLKDGLSAGRDSNFQKSFDKGYEDGFRNGFHLGKLKFQRDHCKNTATVKKLEYLENANKGMCIICTTEKENEDVSDVRKKQSDLFASKVQDIEQDLNCN